MRSTKNKKVTLRICISLKILFIRQRMKTMDIEHREQNLFQHAASSLFLKLQWWCWWWWCWWWCWWWWCRMNITLTDPRSARLNESIGDSVNLIGGIHRSSLFLEHTCLPYLHVTQLSLYKLPQWYAIIRKWRRCKQILFPILRVCRRKASSLFYWCFTEWKHLRITLLM